MPPSRRASAAAALFATTAALVFLATPAQAETPPPNFALFPYSGTPQPWTVPEGVTRATFDVYGAAGGSAIVGPPGGRGGFAHAVVAVTPGERLTIVVGGTPQSHGAAGYNGGAGSPGAGGGGGASDVRRGDGPGDRLLVAGGGGGGGSDALAGGSGGIGGAGGGLDGGDGGASGSAAGGSGGRADGSGGAGGTGPAGSDGAPGAPGSVDGAGGSGGSGGAYGAGGGGGWIGGGGGGGGGTGTTISDNGGGGGGGGGRSHVVTGAQDAVLVPDVRLGNGLVTVTWEALKPSVDVAPSLQGPGVSGILGHHLVCDPGTWSESPAFTFAWLRDGQPIGGQTGTRFDPSDADAHRQIACEVTATNVAGSTTVRTPAVRFGARAVAPPEQYGFSAAPAIAGRVAVGRTLTCVGGVFQGAVAQIERAWLRDGAQIASGATYRVVAADAGRALQCSATAVRAGGVRVVALSPVVAGPPRVTPLTSSVRARRGVARLKVICVAASACRVSATATASGRGRGRRAVLARAAAVRVRDGALGTLSLRLTAAGSAALRRAGARGLSLKLTLAPQDGANVETTVRVRP